MTSSMMMQRRSRRCFQTEEAPEKLEPKEGSQLQKLGVVVASRLREVAQRTWSSLELESSIGEVTWRSPELARADVLSWSGE